jgi:hypothetical protein
MWTNGYFGYFLRGQNPRKPLFYRYLPQHCLYFLPEPQEEMLRVLKVVILFTNS